MSLAILAIAGFTLNSCDKSSTEPVAPASNDQAQSNLLSQNNSEVIKHAITAYMKDQQEKGNLKSGAQFIPAFFSSDGFGLGKDLYFDEFFNIVGGELAFFSTELDEDDFYRLNPDSTISVHINSNTASADYLNFNPDGGMAWGQNAHITMNYTGAWVVFSFEFEGVTYTFQFVDAGSEPNAVVWHGAGKVRFDGTGPKKNLVAHLTASQGWTNVNLMININ